MGSYDRKKSIKVSMRLEIYSTFNNTSFVSGGGGESRAPPRNERFDNTIFLDSRKNHFREHVGYRKQCDRHGSLVGPGISRSRLRISISQLG